MRFWQLKGNGNVKGNIVTNMLKEICGILKCCVDNMSPRYLEHLKRTFELQRTRSSNVKPMNVHQSIVPDS